MRYLLYIGVTYWQNLTRPGKLNSQSLQLKAFCAESGRYIVHSAMLCAAMLFGVSVSAAESDPAAAGSVDPNPFWNQLAREHIDATDAQRSRRRAQNLILFVGDGMDLTTVTAARIFDGQSRGKPGEEHLLPFERFPHIALIKTYNTDAQTPDSAGTITALMSGVKTRIGVLGVDQRVARGDCAASLNYPTTSLFERAEAAGLVTGVVSTTRLTHATPAASFAHAPDRNWEFDGALSQAAKDAGCIDIARQLLETKAGDGAEIMLGGGRAMFFPRQVADPEHADKQGVRADGKNLVQEWQSRYPGSQYVWNDDGLAQYLSALDTGKPPAKLLGLFEPSHMNFEADRKHDAGGEPSLAEMTAAAIRVLTAHDSGFVLLVEAGRIDHGHHAGNAHRALKDAQALALAVSTALEMTDARKTLVVVTADHGHTMSIAGYAKRGNPILGKSRDQSGAYILDARGQPYTTLAYGNGPGHVSPLPPLREVDTTARDYRQAAAVPMAMETHSGVDVPAYAQGPGSHYVHGVMEQNVLYHIMAKALRLD